MKVTKTTSKTYEITQVGLNFCVFDEKFKAIRQKYHSDKSLKCFICDKPFAMGDSVALLVTSGGNRIGCHDCGVKSYELLFRTEIL